MRNYLKEIEIVGAVMVYQEGEVCRWSLNWLYDNCDRVCILLDNWNEETEKIVLEYKDKYPDKTHVAYSSNPPGARDHLAGQIKRRFKNLQGYIREQVLVELKKMHEEKPIDLLIWPDSDETFIDEFPKYLEEFWRDEYYQHMMLGFVEVYDSFRILITQPMAPHGRVYRYNPAISCFPWHNRTRYNPYYNDRRPWKVRNLVVHMCQFTEEYRKRRQFFTNADMLTEGERVFWILPKDVRQMTAAEIQDYQYGFRHAPPRYPSTPLIDYINNKEKYLKENNLTLWTQD